MSNENQAQRRANSRGEFHPLVQQVDRIRHRLELIEAIASLFSAWKHAPDAEPQFDSKLLGYIGELIQVECIEGRHTLDKEIKTALIKFCSREGGSNE